MYEYLVCYILYGYIVYGYRTSISTINIQKTKTFGNGLLIQPFFSNDDWGMVYHWFYPHYIEFLAQKFHGSGHFHVSKPGTRWDGRGSATPQTRLGLWNGLPHKNNSLMSFMMVYARYIELVFRCFWCFVVNNFVQLEWRASSYFERPFLSSNLMAQAGTCNLHTSYTHTHTYLHAYHIHNTHAYTHVYIYIYVYIYTYLYIRTFIHSYMHIYIYIHT